MIFFLFFLKNFCCNTFLSYFLLTLGLICSSSSWRRKLGSRFFLFNVSVHCYKHLSAAFLHFVSFGMFSFLFIMDIFKNSLLTASHHRFFKNVLFSFHVLLNFLVVLFHCAWKWSFRVIYLGECSMCTWEKHIFFYHCQKSYVYTSR